jgi:pilus assembly protein FimV
MPTSTAFAHMRTRFRASAFAAALACLPFAAHAASLGRLTVSSITGQPLRAEIQLDASPEELNGMRARLATPDVYRQAGIDFPSALPDLRLVIDQHDDGRNFIRLWSDRPVSEPMVDLLLELTWPGGRMVREYAFLLDSPDVARRAAEGTTAAVSPTPTTSVPAPPAEAVPVPKTAVTVLVQIREGDTLRQIASDNRYPGVSLEQMMVTLYRANADSFDGDSMSRLRTGAIFLVPEQDAATIVATDEAHKVLVAQGQVSDVYRSKLAAAVANSPAKHRGDTQRASGKITVKVEEKIKPVAEARDQVKIGTTDLSKNASRGNVGGAAAEEELIAKDKELKEAQERIALLEKTVADLQKLVELKNQSMAALQEQSEAKGPKVAGSDAVADKASRPKQAGGLLAQLRNAPLPLAGSGAAVALVLGLFAVKRRKEAERLKKQAKKRSRGDSTRGTRSSTQRRTATSRSTTL